jgi:hypothetical protein
VNQDESVAPKQMGGMLAIDFDASRLLDSPILTTFYVISHIRGYVNIPGQICNNKNLFFFLGVK